MADDMPAPVRQGRWPEAAAYDDLLARARHLLDLRRPSEALPLLDRAARLQPRSVAAHAWMANAYLAQGDRGRAWAATRQALAADPTHEWPHRLASILYRGEGKKDNALREALEAVRLGPEVREALYVLGVAQLALKRGVEARATAMRLLGRHPAYTEAHRLLGDVDLAEKKFPDAELHYRDALAQDPQNLNALNNLAVALQRQKRDDEAYALFEQAARLDPSNDLAQSNLYRAMRRRLSLFRVPGRLRFVLPVLALAAFPVLGGVGLVVLALVAVDRTVVVPWRLRRTSPGMAAFYSYQRKRERERRRARRGPLGRFAWRTLIVLAIGLAILLVLIVLLALAGSR